MPSPLLFDISSIDLNGVMISAEEVGKLNPQSGDMRHLDHVVWTNADYSQMLGVKLVRDNEFWVPGHVPGRPLLPGVIMIEAGAQLCSIQYKRKTNRTGFLGFTRCDNVVFRGQVVPGDKLYLLAREVEHGPRRMISDVQGIVNGKMAFEARITGMVI